MMIFDQDQSFINFTDMRQDFLRCHRKSSQLLKNRFKVALFQGFRNLGQSHCWKSLIDLKVLTFQPVVPTKKILLFKKYSWEKAGFLSKNLGILCAAVKLALPVLPIFCPDTNFWPIPGCRNRLPGTVVSTLISGSLPMHF